MSATYAKGLNPPLTQFVDGPGKAQVTSYCAICHSTEYIPMNAPAMDAAGWDKTLHKMVGVYGAPVPEADQKLILDYLVQNYSKMATKAGH